MIKPIDNFSDEDKLVLVIQRIQKLQRDQQVEVDMIKQEIKARVDGTMDDALLCFADKVAGDSHPQSATFNREEYLFEVRKLQNLVKVQRELTNLAAWSDQEKIAFFDQLFLG